MGLWLIKNLWTILDILWHRHVATAPLMTPDEANKTQAENRYRAAYVEFRRTVKETGTPPPGIEYEAMRDMHQLTRASVHNHFRMLTLGMNIEEIGLYLSSQPLDRLGEGVYGLSFPTWDEDIITIAKQKGIVPQTADRETALTIIDDQIPKVQERIMKECQDYNEAILKAAAMGVVTAKPTEAKREGLTLQNGNVAFRGQEVDF